MYRAYHATCQAGVLGKVAHLALLGVGVLFVGPIALGLVAVALGVVVAILGAALPFVVIGGIAYAPYLLFKHMFGRQQPPVLPDARRVIPLPPKFQTPAVALAVERAKPERRKRVALRIVGEVLSGALVGGLLGAVTVVGPVGEWQTSTLLNCVALGAGIGGVVGFVVGGPRPTTPDPRPTASDKTPIAI
jgi:hypothetical protein